MIEIKKPSWLETASLQYTKKQPIIFEIALLKRQPHLPDQRSIYHKSFRNTLR